MAAIHGEAGETDSTPVRGLVDVVARLAISLSYLMYRLNVKSEEISAFERKMAEFQSSVGTTVVHE